MTMVVATSNRGKLKEFERILSPLGIDVMGMGDLGIDIDIEENGVTFAENAAIKAREIHKLTGKAVVADDSGLCVNALNGRPGVYSARYGSPELPYLEKIAMLLAELASTQSDDRSAYFACAICYIDEDGREMLLEAQCDGMIGTVPQGENGFGYDPVFMIGDQSFSQLGDEQKDRCSHRGKALREFARRLTEQLQENEGK